jgi:tetratricopeptide (TPR) repeat protein
MSDEALYERYKSALRTGHVAAVRGRYEAAVVAYAEAAALAPDRPLPQASLGRSLLRLGRVDEALTAFATALRLAPRDETALAGRAEALEVAGRPAEAAGVLDLLAETLEADGRLADACDGARHALELAESRARRRYLEALIEALRGSTAERDQDDRIALALHTLEATGQRERSVADHAGPGPGEGGRQSGTFGSAETPPPVVEPAPDPAALAAAVEVAVASGDGAVVHEVVLAASAAFRRAGLLDAAIDACQMALAVVPADPEIHLALVELALDQGWAQAARDKLAILDRFMELTADQPERERIAAFAAARLPAPD